MGFLYLVVYNIVYHIGAKLSRADDSFDRRYGTDTRQVREIGSLDANRAAAARWAVRYEPSSAKLVWEILERLKIDYSRYSFIDFGSGKGRVLLIAGQFNFNEVLGIEFSRELHEIALQNIALLPPGADRAGKIQSVHGDATSLELPKSDLVCYFYNPFGPPILSHVAAKLVAHHERYGNQIIVIYHNARHREVFESTKKFTIFDEIGNTLLLSTLPHAGLAAVDIC